MESVTLILNGEKKTVSAKTVKDLITVLDLKTKVAIALNNSVIPSAEYKKTQIRSGDFVEIIAPVCGG